MSVKKLSFSNWLFKYGVMDKSLYSNIIAYMKYDAVFNNKNKLRKESKNEKENDF